MQIVWLAKPGTFVLVLLRYRMTLRIKKEGLWVSLVTAIACRVTGA